MTRTPGRWGSPPLAVQILALLIGALVVAQLVTLLLTLVLPPEPPKRYEMSDIAAALRGGSTDRPLERRVEAGPPDLGGRGWLVSPSATAGLAKAIGVAGDRVVLGFYTELPVAGAVGLPGPPPGRAPLPPDARPVREKVSSLGTVAPRPTRTAVRPILALLAPVPIMAGQADRPPPQPRQGGAPFPPPGPPPVGGSPGAAGAGFPGGGFPGAGGIRPGGPLGGRRGEPGVGAEQRPFGRDGGARLPDIEIRRTPGSGEPQGVQLGGSAVQLGRAGERAPDAGSALRLGPAGERAPDAQPAGTQQALGAERVPDAARPPLGGFGPPSGSPRSAARMPSIPLPSGGRSLDAVSLPSVTSRPTALATAPTMGLAERPTAAVRLPVGTPAAAGDPVEQRQTRTPVVAPAPGRSPAQVPASRPVPIVRGGAGLFGLAPAPFVEGDFVAALRLADGRWAIVSPAPEGFPSAWQRRVLLWFALSLLAVAPIAWAFARRIVGPLKGFADAAERLGRDPAAAILPLDGPAEVGRAAHAFNQMQSRLRGFVDDRTAMIGAISHDLRTPLTRLRFRIEEVPEEQHAGLLGEIEEMEAMISSVIAFMRDASTPGARERRDLAELVGDVVEDAALIGDVRTVAVEPAPVDIDALGVRRVLDNLLNNAIKYGGGRARVALHVENACAVADIVDDGPGIAEAELERVFEPFYRSQAARDSEREGSGLGLAVCRSIARAHGGDVRLFRSQQGFTARVTLPLAYDGERLAA